MAKIPNGYMSGFGNIFSTEAIPDALPKGQNNPQVCPHGLYAEQLSGTAFTAPRVRNQRTWLYRIRPSVIHSAFQSIQHSGFDSHSELIVNPNQMRWSPLDLPSDNQEIDFIDGISLYSSSGEPSTKSGLSIYNYIANKSMGKKAFYNSDGDFLIVPQLGTLSITTELGKLTVEPNEICVIQRGIKFNVAVDGVSRGYILEVYNGHFVIPDLGPIGANGLANPQDFLTPVASYEDKIFEPNTYSMLNKFSGQLFEAKMSTSPFDVVAWHGNYAPYKYDLRLFNTMNTVSYDHPDPSIYTVLTCQSLEPGVAVADFVIFPPRWMVAEHTFRPPYFHRNCMSEYMGMIWGQYDAKEGGFVPGGSSLHLPMTPHGPDETTFKKASDTSVKQEPHYFNAGLAFMFETTFILKVAKSAWDSPVRQKEYQKCWQTLSSHFVDPNTQEHQQKRGSDEDEKASKKKTKH